MTVNGTETLTATVSPDDATDNTVTWSSDNTAVLLYILFTASLAGMGYAGYSKKRKVNR
ncbi:MAG: hypothetical protein J6N76_05055 [Lachnospiraceae bacterium]|nr:hypothetical protein [Lachnospiraceae bacterium]